jgi:hypothetical protein
MKIESIKTITSSADILSLLALLLWPLAAQAQFTFVTNNGAITITDYDDSQANVIIPDSINGYPVTSIGNSAFYHKMLLASVTIPTSVTNIANGAFEYCYNLTNVVIPNSATNIGSYAFEYCSSLRSIVIPNGVPNIGDYTFYYCSSLTNLVLPNSVTNIGGDVFYECSGLTGLTLPDQVRTIGSGAFSYCYNLTNLTIPSSVMNIGQSAFSYCEGLTSETIPNNVTNIGSYAFYYCVSLHQLYFQGNAPTVNSGAGKTNSTVFIGETGTVYYMPGTTGWTNSYGGWTTALWNPQVQQTNGSFGVQTNQFGFNIRGTTNIPIVVEACTNLAGTWMPLQSVSLTNGSFYFSDLQWTNYPGRFYRIRSP